MCTILYNSHTSHRIKCYNSTLPYTYITAILRFLTYTGCPRLDEIILREKMNQKERTKFFHQSLRFQESRGNFQRSMFEAHFLENVAKNENLYSIFLTYFYLMNFWNSIFSKTKAFQWKNFILHFFTWNHLLLSCTWDTLYTSYIIERILQIWEVLKGFLPIENLRTCSSYFQLWKLVTSFYSFLSTSSSLQSSEVILFLILLKYYLSVLSFH